MYRITMTLLLLLAGQPTVLLAQPQDDSAVSGERSEEAAITEAEAVINRRQASQLATEAYAGRVLNIRFRDGGWLLRMDHEGTVFNVRVDALNGAVFGPDERAAQEAAERQAAERDAP